MSSTSILFPWLPDKNYSYPNFDCFWLAQYIRLHYNLSPFPDIHYIYEKYKSENEHPHDLISNTMQSHLLCNTMTIENFDLVCLGYNGIEYLGTIIYTDLGVYCVFMSEKPHTSFVNSKFMNHVKIFGRVI